MTKYYTLKTNVVLDTDIEKKVKEIADKYYKLTNKKIVITSGTRSSKSQASAMYGKMSGGDDLSVYRDQKTAKDILNTYNTAISLKKSKSEIISEIQDKIDEQIKNKKYISKHLIKGAVDIRSRDMTEDDKLNFRKAALGISVSIILETVPPHFHVQF